MKTADEAHLGKQNTQLMRINRKDIIMSKSKTQEVTTPTKEQLEKQQLLDALKTSAGENFSLGRQATYTATAEAFVWWNEAKSDKEYLKAAFHGLPNQKNSSDFARTIVCCFDIDPDGQKSTVSKYKAVLEQLAIFAKRKTFKSLKTDDEKVTALAKHITDKGGLTQLISSTSTSSSTPKLSKDQLEEKLAIYNRSKECLVSNPPKGQAKKYSDGIIITVSKVVDGEWSVVDTLTTDQDKVKRIIAQYKA